MCSGLLSIGIQPDILLCRTDRPIPKEERRKLSLFCNVRESAVIEARDVDNIYAVPEAYSSEGLDAEVLAAFGIEPAVINGVRTGPSLSLGGADGAPDVSRWQLINERVRNPEGNVTIAIVGKPRRLFHVATSPGAKRSSSRLLRPAFMLIGLISVDRRSAR